jgi:hypothetical protein
MRKLFMSIVTNTLIAVIYSCLITCLGHIGHACIHCAGFRAIMPVAAVNYGRKLLITLATGHPGVAATPTQQPMTVSELILDL